MNSDPQNPENLPATQKQVDAVNEFVEKVVPWKNPIMRFFNYGHLPAGRMQDISALCCSLARAMNEMCPDNPEKSAGLRKLLEAKDCFVRSVIP